MQLVKPVNSKASSFQLEAFVFLGQLIIVISKAQLKFFKFMILKEIVIYQSRCSAMNAALSASSTLWSAAWTRFASSSDLNCRRTTLLARRITQ